jgi:hypothetical protein
MKSGWGRDGEALLLLVPVTLRSTSMLRAGSDFTLHGVVFAIFCPAPIGKSLPAFNRQGSAEKMTGGG